MKYLILISALFCNCIIQPEPEKVAYDETQSEIVGTWCDLSGCVKFDSDIVYFTSLSGSVQYHESYIYDGELLQTDNMFQNNSQSADVLIQNDTLLIYPNGLDFSFKYIRVN